MEKIEGDIYQMKVQNPNAEHPLIVPVHVLCNTPDEDLQRNIRHNSVLGLPWVAFEPAHEHIAVLVGGGPSLAGCLDEIKHWKANGATVFAMNAAFSYLRENGVVADYQVVADAKPETSQLISDGVPTHLIASQVDPSTLKGALERHSSGMNVRLWHLAIDGMEEWFPSERVKNGGYALVGGGAAVGNSALCLAYVMGYRVMHCYGYDSSHGEGASHAYPQPMNDVIPTVEVEWSGETYTSSVAMKAQAEKFQITAQMLKQEGCEVLVHGEGLLPAMYNTPPADLTERDKYRLMWQFGGYRAYSPGEHVVPKFVSIAQPQGLIVDFGCGTGRAGCQLAKTGHDVLLVDFADNCRDSEAKGIPFLEWDLTLPMPFRAPYGLCADVMEHIPPDDVDKTLKNIVEAAGTVFFQISTEDDVFGGVIGHDLHLTVRPHDWWRKALQKTGAEVIFDEDEGQTSCFLVKQR